MYQFLGDHTLHSLRGAYRRQLEETAAAIARFEKRLKIDRELQQKIKKVAKELN